MACHELKYFYLIEVARKRVPVSLDPFWSNLLWVLPAIFLLSLYFHYLKFVFGGRSSFYSSLRWCHWASFPQEGQGIFQVFALPALFGEWSQKMQLCQWQPSTALCPCRFLTMLLWACLLFCMEAETPPTLQQPQSTLLGACSWHWWRKAGCFSSKHSKGTENFAPPTPAKLNPCVSPAGATLTKSPLPPLVRQLRRCCFPEMLVVRCRSAVLVFSGSQGLVQCCYRIYSATSLFSNSFSITKHDTSNFTLHASPKPQCPSPRHPLSWFLLRSHPVGKDKIWQQCLTDMYV